MEPCVAEGTGGQRCGGSGDAERLTPILCFSWPHQGCFSLSSTAAKYNCLKLMAYVCIKLLNLHWSLQHHTPKLLFIAHL